MAKNWHHFSPKEHAQFLKDNGFTYTHTKGLHDYYVRREKEEDKLVQVVTCSKEKNVSQEELWPCRQNIQEFQNHYIKIG